MASIQVLDQATVNQIAAGEVIERPSSAVKECVENALDAGANAVTVELRDGGLSLIRITDNGSGIRQDDVRAAFLPHATSKIRSAQDLMNISSLGFRGEALASIAAVSQTELITKTKDSLTGIRYRIEGGEEKELAEIGAPDGTTFLIRNLFFNTPARRKFLKTAATEGAYVSTLMERLALSHPEVSFRLIAGNQTKLHTSGNNRLKDVIYTIYGREISSCLLPLSWEQDGLRISGFAGKPEINRGNRSYENYFINGRYVKSTLITKAIENAYRGYVMQQKYPFIVFHMEIPPELLDVNVHPTKMELRFSNEEEVYQAVLTCVQQALAGKELIPRHAFSEKPARPDRGAETARGPEPFEVNRRNVGGEERIATGIAEQNGWGNPGAEGNTSGSGREQYGRESAGTGQSMAGSVREQSSWGSAGAGTGRGNARTDWEPSTIERIQKNRNNTAISNLMFRSRQEDRETGNAPDALALAFETPAGTDSRQTFSGTPERQAQTSGEQSPEMQVSAAELRPEGEDPAAEVSGDGTRTGEVPAADVPGDGTMSGGAAAAADVFGSGVMPQEADAAASLAGTAGRQMELFEDRLLTAETRSQYRIIGQLFDTYWLFQYRDQLLIMDQHAAHEKVLYERNVRAFREKEFTSQQLQPPIILTLNAREAQVIAEQEEVFTRFGFQIEPFGGREYAVYAVPGNLLGLAEEDLLKELIDSFADENGHTESSMIGDKLALMSCKAAVKGNNRLSVAEVEALLDEMLKLDNPYMCPHGRPTIITFSQTELERKFKRIVN